MTIASSDKIESAYRRLMRLQANTWALTPNERLEMEALFGLREKMLRKAAADIVRAEPNAVIDVLCSGYVELDARKLSNRVMDLGHKYFSSLDQSIAASNPQYDYLWKFAEAE